MPGFTHIRLKNCARGDALFLRRIGWAKSDRYSGCVVRFRAHRIWPYWTDVDAKWSKTFPVLRTCPRRAGSVSRAGFRALCWSELRAHGSPYRHVLTHVLTPRPKGHRMQVARGKTSVPAHRVARVGRGLVAFMGWLFGPGKKKLPADVRISDNVMTAAFRGLPQGCAIRPFRARILPIFEPVLDAVSHAEMEELDRLDALAHADLVKQCRKWSRRLISPRLSRAATISFAIGDLGGERCYSHSDVLKDRLIVRCENSRPACRANTAMYRMRRLADLRPTPDHIAFTAEENLEAFPARAATWRARIFALFPAVEASGRLAGCRRAANWEKLSLWLRTGSLARP